MSKLILVVGGQAVGKMTVADAISVKTGIPMTMNHDSHDLAAKIFGWGNPAQKELSRKIRFDTFDTAINNNIDLIFTYVWAFDQKDDWDFVKTISDLFSGEIYIVELVADMKVRLERNQSEYRLAMKPSKRNILDSEEHLVKDMKKYRLISNDGEVESVFPNYIKINNSNLYPDEVADIVIDRFGLNCKEKQR